MSNEQMGNNTFVQYTSYFGEIAQAGMWGAESLRNTDDVIQNVNVNTYDVFRDALESKNDLIANLQTAYVNTSIDAYNVAAWRLSFQALSDHIRQWTGGSIDAYLTDQGLRVNRKYAQLTPDEISNSNVET